MEQIKRKVVVRQNKDNEVEIDAGKFVWAMGTKTATKLGQALIDCARQVEAKVNMEQILQDLRNVEKKI